MIDDLHPHLILDLNKIVASYLVNPKRHLHRELIAWHDFEFHLARTNLNAISQWSQLTCLHNYHLTEWDVEFIDFRDRFRPVLGAIGRHHRKKLITDYV